MMTQTPRQLMKEVKRITGMTQKDIAKMTNRSASYMSQMLNKRILAKAWDDLFDDLGLYVTINIEYGEPGLHPDEIKNQFRHRYAEKARDDAHEFWERKRRTGDADT